MTKRTVATLAQDYLLFGIETLEFDEILDMLKAADDLYFNEADSFLDDAEYDIARRYAQGLKPAHPFFVNSGSSVRTEGKIKLPHPMGSLDQIYEGGYEKWQRSNLLQREMMIIMDKLDGSSALIKFNGKFQAGYSKGDGIEGKDISRHLWRIHNVPEFIEEDREIYIRGEVIISPAKFDVLRTKIMRRQGKAYKNARNMVAGLMNSSSNDDIVYEYVDFVAYEIVDQMHMTKLQQFELLEKWGFQIVPYTAELRAEHLNDEVLTESLNARRSASHYELDGLVLEVNSTLARQRLNPTRDTLNPAYAVKYKVADASNLAIANVKGVEIAVSKDGYLKPRVNIEPVELVGVTVQYATAFNMKFIVDNQIGPGAKIKITRSGDVIPFILDTVETMPAASGITNEQYMNWIEGEMSKFGDWEWTDTGVDAVLLDAANNETVQFEQLVDFFTSIDVPALKEGNLKTLFDKGLKNPEDIIILSLAEMITVFGKSIGTKVFNGIREKFTNLPVYALMGSHSAFGRGIGVRKMKKLYESFKGDMSLCKSVAHVIAVDGFEHKTATKIANGYPKYQTFYEAVKSIVTLAPYEAPKSGGMNGEIVVFTGFRAPDMEKKIEEQGGKIGSGISGKTTILVAQDPNATSGKLDKARSLGVKVISVTELQVMLGS